MNNSKSQWRPSGALKVLAWETTGACPLACLHCRASAICEREKDELTTDEANKMLESAAHLGNAIIIFSGGEPLLRSDLEEIASKAVKLGHKPVVSCNDGRLLTDDRLDSLKSAGIKHFSFSMHSNIKSEHDEFVRTDGAYDNALKAFERIKNHGMSFQINTTILPSNYSKLEELRKWVISIGASAWHLFFIVPMGRAAETGSSILISPSDTDKVLHYIAENSDNWEIPVKVTCAPQYSRIRAELASQGKIKTVSPHSSKSCMAGSGFIFVSRKGDVKPCGYFELSVGNIREKPLDIIYNESTILASLREPQNLEGKCGICPFKRMCGGCRARTYAVTGNYLSGDESCNYILKTKV